MPIKMQFKTLTLYCLLTTSGILFAADEETDTDQAPSQDATAESSSTEQASRVQPDPNAETANNLALLFTDSLTEVVKLTALEQEFDSYFIQADAAEPVGSLLFFPDDRNHSDWPITLHPLRTELTRYNWQTLVITQPAFTPVAIPERSPVDENEQPDSSSDQTDTPTESTALEPNNTTSEPDASQTQALTDNEPAPEDEKAPLLAEVIQARAEAAVQLLKEQTDLVVIAGIGRGATWASAYAATVPESELENTRLLLINPQQSQDISAPDMLEIIAQLKLATIEIYSDADKQAARKRKRTANRSDIESYLQIKAPNYAWQKEGNQWLSKKVRGVLKVNIEQAMKDKETKKKMSAPAKPNQRPGSAT